jgi:digeranylgeranylglycerophospholipid reductase
LVVLMTTMYDVVVVGAGPTGCRVAEIVAKKGYKVALIEADKEVGEPVQCAGLVSHRIRNLIPDLPESAYLNQISTAKFVSSSSGFELKSNLPFYVVDRAAMDKFLFFKARKAGAVGETGVLFKEYEMDHGTADFVAAPEPAKNALQVSDARRAARTGVPASLQKAEEQNPQPVEHKIETIESDHLLVSTSKGKVMTRILIGADGPVSSVAAAAGLRRPGNMMNALQATVDGEFDPRACELYFSSSIASDFFGWVVPLSETKARIGVASRRGAEIFLKKLVEKRTGGATKSYAVKPDVGGHINFGLMERTSADRVMLVGDAASQVKPFSGGGVVYGLMGAGYCASAAIRALQQKEFTADFFKREYDDKWKKHMAGGIRKGTLYRRVLYGPEGKEKISDRWVNLLFKIGGSIGKPIIQRFDPDLL